MSARPAVVELELDRLAAIYQANPCLARAGVEYIDFLRDPSLLYATLPAPAEGPEPRPLLPAQARIAERLERDELIAYTVRGYRHEAEAALPSYARHRGEGFIEPLSHHAWKVSSGRCGGTRPLR